MKIPFAAQFYEDGSKQFSSQRCHNMFVNVADSEGTKNTFSLEGTPGRELFTELAPNNGSGIRGLYRSSNDRFFAVCGDTLFEIDSLGVATSRGTLNTITGDVGIADNGIVLNIVDGTDGYFYNFTTDAFSVISDPDFPNNTYDPVNGGVTKALYIDSYFIWSSNGTQLFWVSANNASDPTDCIGFDFGSVESNPDPIETQIKSGENIYFFGGNTIEPWYNSGSTIFPFTVRKGAEIEIGTVAPNSVAQILNTVFFLGSNKDGYGIIYQLSGYSVRPISTKPISEFLGKDANDARAWTYSENGNYFYAITVVSLDITFCYCLTSQKWFELSRPDGESTYKRMNISYQEFWAGDNYVADTSINKIWKWSTDYLDDEGERITRDIILPSIFQENRRFIVDSVEIYVKNGVGRLDVDQPTKTVVNDVTLIGGFPDLPATIPAGTKVKRPTEDLEYSLQSDVELTFFPLPNYRYFKAIVISPALEDSTVTITIDGTPYDYFAVAGTPIVDIVNGLVAVIDAGAFGGTVVNVDDTEIELYQPLTDFTASPSNTGATLLIAISGVGMPGQFVCDEAGDNVVPANTLTEIVEPVFGLLSVDNPVAGITGERGDIEEIDPQIEMFYSKNGGRTFDGRETLSMGESGEYDTRLKYRSKGSARDFTTRFRSTAKVKHEWIDCFGTIRVTGDD